MVRFFVGWGAFYGGTAVALGAMGAHKLKELLPADMLNSFETGVRYQLIHALLLLILAGLHDRFDRKSMQWAGYGIVIGTFLFSWSIYLLTTISVTGWEFIRVIGPVTPIGGTLLIVSWFYLMWKGIQWKKS